MSKQSKKVLRVRHNASNNTWFIQELNKGVDGFPGWGLFNNNTYQSQNMAEDVVNYHVEYFPKQYEREE